MSRLIRLYPRSWRERYGEEMAILLEDRPPGPSDVLDLLLGAFDAQLHHRGLGINPSTGTKTLLSVRIGSGAAAAGGVLWIVALLVAVTGGRSDSNPTMVLVGVALLTLIVALAALSAVGSRSHPVLIWASFLMPAIGVVMLVGGATAQLAVGDRPVVGELTPWYLWIIGIVVALVGCGIFGIVSAVAGGLARSSAVVLSVGAVVQLLAILATDQARGEWPMLVGAVVFGLGSILVGVGAARAERYRVADQAT